MPAAKRHVGFASDDGFNTGTLGFSVKLDGAEHVAMICHGYRWLAECFDLLHEGLNLVGAVEQTELGVQMEMNEGRCHVNCSRCDGILVSGGEASQ